MWITYIWFGAEKHRPDDHLLSGNGDIQAEMMAEEHVCPWFRFRRLAKNCEAAGPLKDWNGQSAFITISHK